MYKKAIFIILALAFGLFLFFFMWPGPTLKKKHLELKRIEWPRDFNFLQKKDFILKGIETSINILEKYPSNSLFVLDKNIKKNDFIKALVLLRSDLIKGANLVEALKRAFYIYEIKRGLEKQKLLLTGYYQPELKASIGRTKDFNVPVLKRPEDLISAKLNDFDKGLPAISIFGRVKGNRLIPYYSRKEINKRIQNYEALCWLKNPVDLLELQIQGSGIILLDGKKRFIHYSASNGRPYFSIGKEILKRRILKKEGITWQNIKKWAQSHPREFQKILNKNERYVFFKWEKDGPIGCFNERLVEGVSVALDRSLYPPSLPIIFKGALPEIKSKLSWQKDEILLDNSLLLFNHDTGSAIKGLFRGDLYAGSGKRALALAGKLKNKGRFFILLPKVLDKSEPKNE